MGCILKVNNPIIQWRDLQYLDEPRICGLWFHDLCTPSNLASYPLSLKRDAEKRVAYLELWYGVLEIQFNLQMVQIVPSAFIIIKIGYRFYNNYRANNYLPNTVGDWSHCSDFLVPRLNQEPVP